MRGLDLDGITLLEKIFESKSSLVYRGHWAREDRDVVFKFLRAERPTPDELIHYRQEYEVTRGLNVTQVIGVYDYVEDRNCHLIVLEDIGAQSLSLLSEQGRQIPLREVLEIGASVARTLAEIHAQGVVHGDINPNNIIFNPETSALRVIDFGIATKLPRQHAQFINPLRLAGTLLYISPEQTGRMNRYIDYRTDFYSLGMTLYELLCGVHPFADYEPLQLVYCHLARTPDAPHEINPEVPKIVSDIVMRLLEKCAEDRYVSGWGLATDLERCIAELKSGRRPRAFELGQRDASGRLEIPQKLYGRAAEIQRIHELYGQASEGLTQLLMVSGYSGIGKTSLVQEVHKPITARGGYYLAGKFDQLLARPYAALAEAFSALLCQLLTESEARLASWRRRLRVALRGDAQIIVELLPELERIIGPQAPVERLGPAESNQRFNRVFVAFLKVFCTAERPMVLFLDDVQWADSLSLSIIRALVSEHRVEHLMVVCAYRDNEVDAIHPLSRLRETLAAETDALHDIVLTELSEFHVTDLLAETLETPRQDVAPLAALVKTKTGGNPFFIGQLLHELKNDGLLKFQPPSQTTRRRWSWEFAKIEQLGFTDNVVDLMIGKIRRLPAPCQRALQLAACLGNRFELKTLALVYGECIEQTAADLQDALLAGYVQPTSGLEMVERQDGGQQLMNLNLRFLHDRVQQASYALIPDEQRPALHTRIGQLLIEAVDESERDLRLFEIVDHLNRGEQPRGPGLRDFILLNLQAARRAKQATAFEASREYISSAMAALPASMWTEEPDVAMEIVTRRIEAESITGHHEDAERLAKDALKCARTPLQRGRIYRLLINQRTLLAQFQAALDLGLKALAELGIEFPDSELEAQFLADRATIKAATAERSIASLIDVGDCTSEIEIMKIELLSSLTAVTYQVRPELMGVIATRIITTSITHGNHAESMMGYAAYSVTLTAIFDEFADAYEFGKLSLAVADRFRDRTQQCRAIHILTSFSAHWMRTFADDDLLFQRGFQAGVEVGENQYTSYLITSYIINCFVRGDNLEKLDEQIEAALLHVNKSNNTLALLQQTGLRLVLNNLRGDMGGPDDFTHSDSDEATLLEAINGGQVNIASCQYNIEKAQACYINGRYEQCERLLSEASDKLAYIPGYSLNVTYHLYFVLALCARAKDGLDDDNRVRVEDHLRRLELFASNCPENSSHKFFLARAELDRVEGRALDAIESYDLAIAAANEHGFTQIEAIANQRAGSFWRDRGKPRIAAAYFHDSVQCFRSWGALRPATALVNAHPELLSQRRGSGTSSATTTDTGRFSEALDLQSLVRAFQALSVEHSLPALMVKVMETGLESAGAQRGLLLIERDEILHIKAQGRVTSTVEVELMSIALADYGEVSCGVVQYVARTGEALLLNDAVSDARFSTDPYVVKHGACSILCLPLLNQGSLIGVVYMESLGVTAAFTSDRVDLLKMLMTPAAIALENALLRSHFKLDDFTYQVGGSLSADSRTYVTRRADRELDHALRAGDYCHILCARQMGKSSLGVQTMRRLRAVSRVCVALDLSIIGNRHVGPEQWYAGIARRLLSALSLEVDLRSWWRAHDHLSPVQRIVELIDTFVLEQVHKDLIIFVDEVDSVLSLGFEYDDFFTMIRGLFNRRAEDPRYKRLSFVFLGVASPAELINDTTRTPFNIGRSIRLGQFKAPECGPLMTGLAKKCEPVPVLQAVLAWTGGQPFLTQKVCQILQHLESSPRAGGEAAWVRGAVLAHVVERWQEHDEPVHFRAIQNRIVRSPQARELIKRYALVLEQSGELAANESSLENEFSLTGLVLRRGDKLMVANRIYEEIFDTRWIESVSATLEAE